VGNQQFRVDIITTSAALGSTAPGDVLATMFQTISGDPAVLDPTDYCVDLTAFAGQTVRLRVAVAQTQDILNGFVDDVRLVSDPGTGDPTDRECLDAVRSDLDAILATVTNSDDRKKLNEAIKKLGEADRNEYWDDQDRPNFADGNKVFDKSKDASRKLMDLYKGAKTLSLRPQMLTVINDLMACVRMMATRRIDELAVVGPGSNNPADAEKKRLEALEEIAKGDAEAAKPKPDSAIDHYKHGWQKATDKLEQISKE
jgi:hypothetical protein